MALVSGGAADNTISGTTGMYSLGAYLQFGGKQKQGLIAIEFFIIYSADHLL
jgi:hypothetical protein